MAKQRWQHIESPSTVFAIAPAGDVGWVLGTNEGVWKFVDGICSITAEALRPAAITAVAASPMFVMHPVALAGAADGIARSSDGCVTWVSSQMARPAQVTQLAISPGFMIDGFAFAATMQDGVLCSADQGVSWQSWNFGLLDLETVALAVSPGFTQDETVFVATVRGLFRSTNAGRAWREMPIPQGAAPLSSIAFVGSVLVAGSETSGILYSTDMGGTWSRHNTYKSGQINAVASSLDGKLLAVATPSLVVSSSDAGQTWGRAEGHVPQGVICVAIGDNGKLIVGTQEEGLWVYA